MIGYQCSIKVLTIEGYRQVQAQSKFQGKSELAERSGC
jgi:hypothetical protein